MYKLPHDSGEDCRSHLLMLASVSVGRFETALQGLCCLKIADLICLIILEGSFEDEGTLKIGPAADVMAAPSPGYSGPTFFCLFSCLLFFFLVFFVVVFSWFSVLLFFLGFLFSVLLFFLGFLICSFSLVLLLVGEAYCSEDTIMIGVVRTVPLCIDGDCLICTLPHV